MNRFSLVLASCASLASLASGCGAAPPPTAITVAAPVTPAASGGANANVAPPSRSRRGASEALRKAWAFEAPTVVAYADFGGLVRTALMSSFGKNMVAMMATTEASAASRKCLGDALAEVQELAFGTDGHETLLIARTAPSATRWIGPCVQALFPEAKPASLAGATEAWTNKTDVFAVSSGGLFFLGPMRLVEAGLDGRGAATATTLDKVTLGEGEYVAWLARMFEGQPPAKGTLLATDDHFRIEGDASLPAERAAKEVETELAVDALAARLPKTGMTSDDTRRLARLVQAFSVKRDGHHVAVSFDLHEPAAEQARDLGAAAALAIYGVRKYIANAKAAEARNAVGQLAKLTVVDWESEPFDGKPRTKRRLVSYPAVPRSVPKGVKYQSTAADWKPWAPLGFSMELPQYYQYEIKAAKDGASAEIIARGDLNGDGKTSQFKVRLVLDRASNRVTVSPSLEEIDPEE